MSTETKIVCTTKISVGVKIVTAMYEELTFKTESALLKPEVTAVLRLK
jgi:hypothetical protein